MSSMPPGGASNASVALVGAEFEENLSIRYLAAAAAEAGFAPSMHAFNQASDGPELAAAIAASDPLVVGLSVPFQHRAAELLGLAPRLREAGYTGPIVVGGHFATFEYRALLEHVPAIDAVVRHEGETTFVELCERVRDTGELQLVAGAVLRDAEGVRIGPPRKLPKLDTLAPPLREDEPHDILGVRCAPIVGSRGCYADCSFCCIYAYSDNAAGPRYRMRSIGDIVAEMKREYVGRGVRLFVFHDDNFFVPYTPKNLRRYRELAASLDAEGMRDIGLVIKCRPNDVDRELFTLLRDLGMIRAYVGIETNSDEGVVSLNRRITSDDNRRAMELLRELGVYSSFNVLIFDPEATLEGVAANLDFMAEYADVPFNFCRAEVYAGTPLKGILEQQGRLRGDWLAWDYEMREPRVELLFRIATTAFATRNFRSDGLANLNMGLRFDGEVLRRFYPDAWDAEWHARLTAFSRAVGEDSVARLREAWEYASHEDPTDRRGANAFTLQLARGVARADLRLLAEAKRLRREMEARVSAVGGAPTLHRYAEGLPVWAAETERLGSSVGLEISTELLPAPSAQGVLP